MFARGYDKYAIIRGAVGAPAAAVVLEEVIAAGAKEIIIFGPAVAFSPLVAVGDLILPTESVIADGTSPFYVSPRAGAKPDAGMRSTAAHLLERGGAIYRSGRVASCDAVYVRPAARYKSLRRARVLAVDMELAALLAVSRFRGVKAAAVLVVSAPVGGVPTELGADRPVFLNAVVRAAAALANWPEASAGAAAR
jgi:uridine phosphorylase